MSIRAPGLLLIAGSVAAATLGCAHRGPDPFVLGPPSLARNRGRPPACFTAPLADCIGDPSQRHAGWRLESRWRYPFHPDLHRRVCRADPEARRRFLEGARQLADDDPQSLTRVYLGFVDGCSSLDFCNWALDVAADTGEPVHTRNLLLEGARRGCETVAEDRLVRVGEDLGRSLATETPWRTSTQQTRCAGLEHAEKPWDDLTTLHSAGCLDLGSWLEKHSDHPESTAAALERCADGHEIRYREADCLRELAGLDRARAVAFLDRDPRRGWGMASTTNRYARTLLRFPQAGRLETKLAHLGLLPVRAAPTPAPGRATILPWEILESHGRLSRFNPSCNLRYCEHAPLMYRLADLASPTLDDLIIEERWPALEEVDLGSGTRSVSTSISGIPVTFHVEEDEGDGTFDKAHHQKLRNAFELAHAQPHEIIVYADGWVYELSIRNLGEWYDLETLLGALNTILADRESDLRYATLAPHCIPCAQVVIGPRDGLIEAAFAGLLEVVDPFYELWTRPGFDSRLLTDTDGE